MGTRNFVVQDTLVWGAPGTKKALRNIIQSGQIIVGTSDTVLGLLAPLTEEAFLRLNAIKVRVDKPYIILIKGADSLPFFVDMPLDPCLMQVVSSCWPGPLTLIMRARKDLPQFMKSAQGTIALRVPQHEGLLGLLSHFNGLFSTSANKTGEPVPLSSDAIDPEIRTQVACIVTDRKEQARSTPSTILDCTGPRPRIVREGAYPVAFLENVYGGTFER